jgi:phosphoglycolate phosphatase-like HAD superfamily hydrolase
MSVILVDIDHTIANAFWRDSMIGVSEWDYYHSEGKHDRPFRNVVKLINSLYMAGYEIVAITGRSEKFRKLTMDWFINNEVDIEEILMRPDDCFLKNAEMKLKLIEMRFKGNYNDIHFLIDDNEDTILAFSKLGITTLQIRNIQMKDLFK